MREVVLLEKDADSLGIRLLGRTTEPEIVSAVESHLLDVLRTPRGTQLRLVREKAPRHQEGPPEGSLDQQGGSARVPEQKDE